MCIRDRTNFDCSCLYVSDRETLIKSLTINPEYLKTEVSDSDTVFDYRDWQVPLGRRFRALKLWSVIRYYGINGIQSHIRGHITSAKLLSDLIAEDNRFEIMAPTILNLVCFRYKASDQFNILLLNELNKRLSAQKGIKVEFQIVPEANHFFTKHGGSWEFRQQPQWIL